MIENALPKLHGLCRAISLTPVQWSTAHLEDITRLALQNNILALDLSQQPQTSQDGFYTECVVTAYARYGQPLAAPFVRNVLLQTCASLWERRLLGSTAQTFEKPLSDTLGPSSEAGTLATEFWNANPDFEPGREDGAQGGGDLLKVLVLCHVAAGQVPPEAVLAHLLSLSAEQDEEQLLALQLLAVLVRM